MPRPRKPRCLRHRADVFYFKPRGVPLKQLEEVEIFPDELEALKLYEVDHLDQTQAAAKMGISQPTFARIIEKANSKVAEAIVYGKAIKITTVN